jgi:hypothetical protein
MTRLRRPLALAFVLTAAIVLPSCSQAESPESPTAGQATGTPVATSPSTSPASSSPTSDSPTTSTGRRIDITVTGRQVTPKPATVNIAVGESLTISVTSDQDNQLHAHGFDIELDIKAGQPTEVTVKGTKTGVFEVELHEPELRLFQVAVR